MKTYLVTGGCGFIGSHLVDALLERGHAVRVLDNLSTGKRANLNACAEVIIGDVGDEKTVRLAMKDMDGCFHLAAVASVRQSIEDWTGTHITNLTGAINVFNEARCCNNGNAVSVVYASSAAVYGDNADMPLAENAATRPLTAYGADKLGCEQHARVAGLIHQVPTMGFRFFNVYGPRQDSQSPYSGVISIFAANVLAGQSVTVFGDGQQIRDFTYVSDVVMFLLKGMEQATLAAPVFNVCTGTGTNIIQIAKSLASVNGTDVDLAMKPVRTGDIRVSLGNPDQALQSLGLKASVSLGSGLRETLRFLKASDIAAA
ncbi:MAG: epimerase [Rhodospirillaceae bacterium]|nr:MAG: epimerase [Rhodospirillaceae bacterium]